MPIYVSHLFIFTDKSKNHVDDYMHEPPPDFIPPPPSGKTQV